MPTNDITDLEVCEAFRDSHSNHAAGARRWPHDLLQERTGQPFKACWAAMQRALGRDLVDYGINLRSGWLTEKGQELLASTHSDGAASPLIFNSPTPGDQPCER